MSMPGRIVVVGGGLAATAACAELRRAGYAGELVLVSAEKEPPYDRPPLSKQLLSGEMDAASCALHPEAFYRDNAVALELGVRATAVDMRARQVDLAGGRSLGFDRLLLATGGRARRLPPSMAGGRAIDGVHALRTLDDALALKGEMTAGRRMVVIGGGFLGLEVAATGRALGLDVVVVEAAGALLHGRIDPAAAGWLSGLHRDAGVGILAGQGVAGYEGGPRIGAVRLADGRRLPCDLCVEAIGMEPETALARSAGAAIDGGIVTGADGKTSVPELFAAGDAASAFDPRYRRHLRLESWQAARQQGQAAARGMLGLAAPAPEVPWFWSSQHGAMVHMAGLPQPGDMMVQRGSPESGRFVLFGLRNGIVTSLFAANAMADARIGKDLIDRTSPVRGDALADPSVRLRSLLQGPARAGIAS